MKASETLDFCGSETLLGLLLTFYRVKFYLSFLYLFLNCQSLIAALVLMIIEMKPVLSVGQKSFDGRDLKLILDFYHLPFVVEHLFLQILYRVSSDAFV